MDADALALGQMIYGEVGSLDRDTMIKVGSTALNRLEAGRDIEFGSTMPEVLQKGYYAVSKKNDPYTWATTGKFPNKDEENRFKEALSIAYALKNGTIERTQGQFFFTDKERKKMTPKQFDFKKVKEVDKTDKYKFYSY